MGLRSEYRRRYDSQAAAYQDALAELGQAPANAHGHFQAGSAQQKTLPEVGQAGQG